VEGPVWMTRQPFPDLQCVGARMDCDSNLQSWFLQSPRPNGDWHAQTSIKHIASDLGFGARIEQTPSASRRPMMVL
jgi:hypothetical protein